jgi:phage repressor protein C with HTH and peptisase S24 domain
MIRVERPGDAEVSKENDARRERLMKARVEMGFASAQKAADGIGVPPSTYRAHENGSRPIGKDDAFRYGKALGVYGEWLWSGVGEMIDKTAALPSPNAVFHQPYERRVIRKLHVKGRALGGEGGIMMIDGLVVDEVECLPSLENVTEAYAVYVAGDSMEPRYYAGEVAYIHPLRPPRKGDFVVVQVTVDGTVTGYLKRYVGWREDELIVEQFNPPKEIAFTRAMVKDVHLVVGSAMR